MNSKILKPSQTDKDESTHNSLLYGRNSLAEWKDISSFLLFWLENNPLIQPEKGILDAYYTSYRKRFSLYIQHHYAEQTIEICREIINKPNPSVLEIGTGCGTEALWFGLMGATVTAIDLSVDRLAVARSRKSWLQDSTKESLNVNFLNISLFDFSPKSQFDIIWMEQTFHHLEPRQEVYKKLFSLLRPGGKLFISESNAWNPFLQFQLFLRRGFKTRVHVKNSSGIFVQYGNERIIFPFLLCRELKKVGFDLVESRSFRILPNLNPPLYWLNIERLILKIFPFISTHYNVCAQKP